MRNQSVVGAVVQKQKFILIFRTVVSLVAFYLPDIYNVRKATNDIHYTPILDASTNGGTNFASGKDG